MQTFTTEEFFAKLDELGENEVRIKLVTKIYGPNSDKRALAEEWLRRKEDQRRDEREDRSAERARRMMYSAWAANVIAIIAAITAIVAAIKAS